MLPSASIAQLRIVTGVRRTWIPSSSKPETRDAVEHDVVDAVDHDPVLAADTVTFLIVTPSARTTMPPRTTAPRSPTSRSRAVDHERALVHAGGQMHVGRQPEPPVAAGAREHRDDRGAGDDADAAELAAVGRIGEPQQREAGVAERLRDSPRRREERERRHERSLEPERADERQHQPELEHPSGSASPARLVASSRW